MVKFGLSSVRSMTRPGVSGGSGVTQDPGGLSERVFKEMRLSWKVLESTEQILRRGGYSRLLERV